MQTHERPISSVLKDIVDNVQEMVRSELRMARIEATEELGKLRTAGILMGVGVFLLAFSVLFLLWAALYGLSAVMATWLAALIVGVGVGVIAVMCVALGISRFRTVRAPPQTVATVKETVEWAKQPTR